MSGSSARVEIGGPLGQAAAQSLSARLRRFIVDASSEPLALFTPEGRDKGMTGDWYGEHVGKWLIAASRAAIRTGDEELADRVKEVASFLCEQQESDGSLGTYAQGAPCRFTNPAAESGRTWDVWVHSYTMLGLLEAHRFWPNEKFLTACVRIFELLQEVFDKQGRDISRYGNHDGLSSLIVIHPLAELSKVIGDKSPAQLGSKLLEKAESSLELTRKLANGDDISTIGTGKIYQLCWLLQGLVRLHECDDEPHLLAAAKAGWKSIREDHLTPSGGPWGGVGRHKEVFNDKGFFSPYGLVETCSAMAWVQLSRALHRVDPSALYAEEIEKTLYNTVLGAMDPNGEDWCYFTFPNGRRNATYYWACCKSSGAIALEEASLSFFSEVPGGVSIDMYGPSRAELRLSSGERVVVEQETNWPAAGEILVRFSSDQPTVKSLRFRIPTWAKGAKVELNGVAGPAAIPGKYANVDVSGAKQATIRLEFPMAPRVLEASHTLDHHGHEIARRDYFAVCRGPLVYAAGLIDGYKMEETLRAPKLGLESRIAEVDTRQGSTLALSLPGHNDIQFLPYHEAGGPATGSWRATWLGVAWQ